MQIKEYDSGIKEYTITNKNATLSVLNIGGVITELTFFKESIVQKFEDYSDYLDNSTYLGSVVGRSAGRIRDGKIPRWEIPKNYLDKHNLHGNEMHYKFYDVKIEDNVIELSLFDPEGDFPGNMNLTIRYTLNQYSLVQEFIGKSDKPTIMNFTNHAYFTLDKAKNVLDYRMQIEADNYIELDEELLPVKKQSVVGTALDFTEWKKIIEAKEMGMDQFEYTKFIDHPFQLTGDVKIANGRHELLIKTTSDYLVCYTGNYLGDEKGQLAKSKNEDYYAICLETQKCPGDTELVSEYYAKTTYLCTKKQYKPNEVGRNQQY